MLSRSRAFITPKPGESLEELAARALPGVERARAVDDLKSWNLHIFLLRRPPGQVLGSDVVFVEPPLADAP
jgi:hypothetical protein